MRKGSFYVAALCAIFAANSPATEQSNVTITIDGENYQQGEITLPEGTGSAGQATPSTSSRMASQDSVPVSTETERWSVLEEYEDAYTRRLAAESASFGNIDVSRLSADNDESQIELGRFLRLNQDIVGNIEGYEFQIDRVHPGAHRSRVRFHQVVDGIEMPASTMRVDKNGEVEAIHISLSSPNNPLFDRAGWLSERELKKRIESVISEKLGRYEEGGLAPLSMYKAIEIGDQRDLKLIYQVHYLFYDIWIDVHSGEVVNFSSTARSITKECVPGPNYVVYNNYGCDSGDVSGTKIFTIFRQNGSCVGGNTNCNDQKKLAVKGGVDTAITWTAGAGHGGPTGYHIM